MPLSFFKLHLVFILYIVSDWIRLQSLAKDIGLNKTSKNGLVHLDSSEFEWHFNITGFLQNDGHLLFENQASLKLYEDMMHHMYEAMHLKLIDTSEKFCAFTMTDRELRAAFF